jgi:glycosyltransferase involved in cell wall biosynthesis
VVRPGETGILVPAHDPAALAEAIAALAGDAVRRRRLGQAGRALVERAFAEEIVARETLAIYETLLAEVAPRR